MKRALFAFLERERRANRRDVRDLHLQPVEERVADGAAIAGLRLAEVRGALALYAMPNGPTKMRPGDPCWLSDGQQITAGIPVEIVELDRARGRIGLRPDPFARVSQAPPPTGVLDRRNLDLTDHLLRGLLPVLEAEKAGAPAGAAWVLRAVAGKADTRPIPERLLRAREAGENEGLTPSQRQAFEVAVAARELALIQGPPGTGKTRVAAAVVAEALRQGERVLISALTHRAINNVLVAAVELSGKSQSLFKLGRPHQGPELEALGIATLSRLPRHPLGPDRGFAVGATPFGAARLRRQPGPFDLVLLDEAGQVPIPHGMSAMAGARRGVLVGDHQQLGPVITGERQGDPLERSIFALLADQYPNEIQLLRETWRMNAGICRFPSRVFYGDAVQSHAQARDRRLQLREGGRHRRIFDPACSSVWVVVSHLARRNHSPEEAKVVATLVRELIAFHGLPPQEIAVVSPFRAHAGAVASAISRALPGANGALVEGLVVDTAERIQGQEREVVLYTFGSSDRDYLARNAGFLFDPGRLNVALTRARTKRIIVGSAEVARVRPRDLEGLRRAALIKSLWDDHQVEPPSVDDALRVLWDAEDEA